MWLHRQGRTLDCWQLIRKSAACMTMRKEFFIATLVSLMGTGACGAAIPELRTRAAFDFRCSQAELKLTELNKGDYRDGEGAVYGVEGCGKRATYVQMQHGGWVLNTETGRPIDK
jgi:hypothetical protein